MTAVERKKAAKAAFFCPGGSRHSGVNRWAAELRRDTIMSITPFSLTKHNFTAMMTV